MKNSGVLRRARALIRRDGFIPTLQRAWRRTPRESRAAYQRWLARHAPTAADLSRLGAEVDALPWRPTISVLTPVYNTTPAWLRACVDSVRAQVYPHWELCLADDGSTSAATRQALDEVARLDPRIRLARLSERRHVSAATNAALALATGELVALLDHDDELTPDALAEVVTYLNARPECDVLYSDEDKRDAAGRLRDPYFKPDWSPDHFLNCMYANHLMVLRRSVVQAVGGFRAGYEGAQDYDLLLRVMGDTTRIGHLPKVLYHWRQAPGSAAVDSAAKPWAIDAARRALADHVARTGFEADVLDGAAPGLFRVKRRLRGAPLVSIVMPTADRLRAVDGRPVRLPVQAIDSVRTRSTYREYEFVLVDHGGVSEETRAALATVRHRRVTCEPGASGFNFSRAVNAGVREAAGDYVVLFNDDLEVIAPDWIQALLEYAEDPGVGAVGAKLRLPDGRLQHIGIVLGVCGGAAHAFHLAPAGTPGYFGSALGPRNYSAVTAACLMTRRAAFGAVGGFDERLATDFNDVDFCLRLGRAGLRTVFTPYAELCHHESTSYGAREWRAPERDLARSTWPAAFARDPFYNPNLTRAFADYRLGE